jgi:hypothetical protein
MNLNELATSLVILARAYGDAAEVSLDWDCIMVAPKDGAHREIPLEGRESLAAYGWFYDSEMGEWFHEK